MLIFKPIFGIMLYMHDTNTNQPVRIRIQRRRLWLYSLAKQIFSLMIFLFHARVKNALVNQSANAGKCRFHVANIAVAKEKGNVQTHMIKNMTILITANIWKNIMLLNSLTIYIDHLLIRSCLSTPVENEHRKSQSSKILFCVTVNKLRLNSVIFSFLTKRPSGQQLILSEIDWTIYRLAIFHHSIVKLRQGHIYSISLYHIIITRFRFYLHTYYIIIYTYCLFWVYKVL